MSSEKPAFTFGGSHTNKITSNVNKDGQGVVIICDNHKRKAKFRFSQVDHGVINSTWDNIPFIYNKHWENFATDEPFYLGFNGSASNPVFYSFMFKDKFGYGDSTIQFANLHDWKLTELDPAHFKNCIDFCVKGNVITLMDSNCHYFLGDSPRHLAELGWNEDETLSAVVDLGITGGQNPVPVALLQELDGKGFRTLIRWWFDLEERYFEDNTLFLKSMVCFDDYIVWDGKEGNKDDEDCCHVIGWNDIRARGKPITSCNRLPVDDEIVALAKSGSQLSTGHIWYAGTYGEVYYVDTAKVSSCKVLNARRIPGGSRDISQLWADDYFLYVLTANGVGGAWKIADVIST
ncbi:hypothetical protein ZTR_09540 [Talaromyces verruculosus]|nr:hypothetical protein ZTR_09540 [Talaromyces verruculosus]